MDWQYFEPFLVALAIGLLLGFERERSHPRAQLPAGSRSFALLALSGAIAAAVGAWVIAAGVLGVAALMTAAYLRTRDDDPGTTTVIAALISFLLGALAFTRPGEAAALAVVVAVLLVSKSRIHRFARETVSELELEDAIKFFVVAVVILPLLPDRALGPYGVLNPSRIWLLVVLLTGIGWVGYIGVRALGPQRGLLVTGLAGGFVSASATTASMGRLSRSDVGVRAPLASALVASLATFVQLLIVIGIVDADVLRRLWPSVAAGAAVLLVIAALVYRGARKAEPGTGGGSAPDHTPDRPFALRPALLLAVVLTLALLVGRWAADLLGPNGLVLASLAAGLTDAHAGAVAAATLSAQGAATVATALVAIGAALGSNLLVKVILAYIAGGRRFGTAFLAAMAAPAVVFAVALTLTVGLG
ncbi:MAG: DUF4010 domain-containing protein [Gordonia sp. (in: high G+C Gram-positive bacteria)]|uniref:MgtC/SapB family protein n=1 Tax=Gordonia TaxID=2053 RepID=UPI003266098B